MPAWSASFEPAAYHPASMTARDPKELAEQAGVEESYVTRLVELGILNPGDDGGFSRSDVYRVRFVLASDRGGLSIEAIARSIHEGRFSFAFLDEAQYGWAPLSARTYRQVANEVDLPIGFVLAFEEALGRVRPGPDDPVPADLPGMLEAPRRAIAAGVGPDVELRLVRVFTDALSRVVETDADVFHRHIEMPILDAGRSHGEMLGIVNDCLLYTSPSPRDRQKSRMPSSA